MRHLFSIDEYYNNYFNSYNYQIKKNTTNDDQKKLFNYDFFDSDSKSNIYYYDLYQDDDGYEYFLDFLFYELEDNFNENKLFEILQFCIDNTHNKENFMCVNNEFGLIEICRFHNQENKVFVDKIDYNNIFDKKFEINFQF